MEDMKWGDNFVMIEKIDEFRFLPINLMNLDFC
jgi:hypothetical protein